MSGLTKSQKNLQFLRIKDGSFYLSTDKEFTDPYNDLTGFITDLRFKDEEYNGSKLRKLSITIKSTEATYSFSISADSSYFSTLVNFLKNADLTKEITLSPSIKVTKNDKGVEVKKYTMFVRQGKDTLKAYYSKETGNSLPEFKKVKISGKTVWDKTDFLEALEKIVLNEFVPTIKGNKNVPLQEESNEGVVVDTDELPWEDD